MNKYLNILPHAQKEVPRTMLALIAQKKWKLNAIDIKTAFLSR